MTKLDLAFDLVTQIEVKDGVATRIYSSESHRTVLGHDPESCNGDCMTLTNLFTQEYLRETAPHLIEAFESSGIDGLISEMPLLHADGREIWFEWRLTVDSEHPQRCLLVFRDITDRRERHRLELENARLSAARERDEHAMHFLAHELKNRFVAVRGGVESARLSVVEHAAFLLAPPHNCAEVFADANAAVDRGIFICLNRGIALQLAHRTYELLVRDFELTPELHTASGKRAQVVIDADVPNIVRLDGNLVLHVLENFVANAANYGAKDGRVTLRASRVHE